MSKYRIMIVDDDADARCTLSIALQDRYEIVEANDGLDALSKLELYEPDIAIIDIMMPIMDGYHVCEAIRRHKRFNNMMVLFLSAYGSKENVIRSYDVGANLFLAKPIDPDRVLKNIEFSVQHEPPPLRTKKYTPEQLVKLEEEQILEARRKAQEPPAPDALRGPESPEPPPTAVPEPAPEPEQVDIPEVDIPEVEIVEMEIEGDAIEVEDVPTSLLPRVLIVDDDQEMLNMLNLALRDAYEITTATNGLEAIERMVEYQPDFILLDIMMPKMNGYQLLQSIRRNAYFKNLPVVVISAKSSPKDRDYAARLGADHFIPKPYRIEELLQTTKEIVTARGFTIRVKKVSMFEINEINYKAGKEREDRQRHLSKVAQYQKMREFIREGMSEDTEKD